MSRSASSAASALLGLALAAVAFAGAGGLQLVQITRVQLPLILVSGLVVCLSILYGRRGAVAGALALLLFTLLAVLTGLSIAWSIVPEDSWIEANRTLTYLMVFAAALFAARLVPEGWAAVLNGLLLALGAVVIYALATRVWPSALAENDVFARISEPFGYWNAVGAAAAMGVPPALWLGARRSGHAATSALAYPLLGLFLITIFLTYSRGALLAALVGIALWLVAVPLRLRSLVVLGVSALGAAPVVVWALTKSAFTQDRVLIVVRESVADEFGILLLLTCLALLVVGLAIGFRVSLAAPSLKLRRRVGIAVALAALALPLVAVSAVAASERGLRGTVTERVRQITSEEGGTAVGPERLGQVSSARGRYWRQAGGIFKDRPRLGTGAGTFADARLRYRRDEVAARHAHGYVPQTMADLGMAGLAVSAALVIAWLIAAARTLGTRPGRGRRRPWSAERVGLSALAISAVVLAVHGSIDWTWFVPGPTVMSLVAAGWVAGRGSLWAPGEPADRDEPASAVAAPPETPDAVGTLAPPGEAPVAVVPSSRRERMTLLARRDGWRLVLALGVLVATMISMWAAWQPQRSDAASERALTLVEARLLPEALAEARSAREIDPLASKPLFVEATVEDAAGRPREALRLLERAIKENPADPQAWLRLGDYQLHTLGRPREALETLRGALFLDPRGRTARTYFLEARAGALAEGRRQLGGSQPGAGRAPRPGGAPRAGQGPRSDEAPRAGGAPPSDGTPPIAQP